MCHMMGCNHSLGKHGQRGGGSLCSTYIGHLPCPDQWLHPIKWHLVFLELRIPNKVLVSPFPTKIAKLWIPNIYGVSDEFQLWDYFFKGMKTDENIDLKSKPYEAQKGIRENLIDFLSYSWVILKSLKIGHRWYRNLEIFGTALLKVLKAPVLRQHGWHGKK